MRHPGSAVAAARTVEALALAAVRALYVEVALEPKPGLVSFRDTGSHADMDAGTFFRSLFALRGYFPRIAHAGMRACAFPELEALGREAETRMLAATRGINTHRGAVFCLGLLCASAGRLLALGAPLTPQRLRATLAGTWGQALLVRAAAARARAALSHGQRAAQQHGLRSAGDEAAAAFPTLFEVTLPALEQARSLGWPERRARVQALFATIAALDDTNLVHRGGIEGLRFAQQAARDFLAGGGAGATDWLPRARAIHADFVARRLSPGGAADLLAAACWVQAVCEPAAGAASPWRPRAGVGVP